METPTNQTQKRVFIETYGCQMNDNDTQKMLRILAGEGYAPTQKAEEADLLILNTCAIREKAEQRMFSSLGSYQDLKNKPGVKIGVAGCVAQLMGDKIRSRAPYVDFVFGTYNIHKLPEILRAADRVGGQLVWTGKLIQNDFDFLPLRPEDMLAPDAKGDPQPVAMNVTIQNGCNKNCSYCVVPTTRGREVSRPVDDILSEIALLCQKGVREITLVGQTVNSYGIGTDVEFPELLRRIENLPSAENIARVRFITSHPRDLDESLMSTMAECKKVCEHLHLPVQSGSGEVLRQMYRGYTGEKYLEKVARLRGYLPNLSLTSDIIVAFPGETEAQFQETLALVEAAQFDTIFSFIYSKRPFTRAATWPNQIDDEVAKDRLQRLNQLQARISKERLSRYLGRTVEVLVESTAKPKAHWGHSDQQLQGRTRTNKMVHFNGVPELKGTLVKVAIEKVNTYTLEGKHVH